METWQRWRCREEWRVPNAVKTWEEVWNLCSTTPLSSCMPQNQRSSKLMKEEKCPATGIGGLSSVSLVLVAAQVVPQLVLAAPSHVSPILTTTSGGTTWIADATGDIQHRTDPLQFLSKRTLIRKYFINMTLYRKFALQWLILFIVWVEILFL